MGENLTVACLYRSRDSVYLVMCRDTTSSGMLQHNAATSTGSSGLCDVSGLLGVLASVLLDSWASSAKSGIFARAILTQRAM